MQLSLHHIKSFLFILAIESDQCIATIVFTKTVVASLSANFQNEIGSVEYLRL